MASYFKSSKSLFALIVLSLASTFLSAATAGAAPIYGETLSGNGETRSIVTRSINVPTSGRYYLTLKNGTIGPRVIEQCYTEDTIEAKRQCLFNNLTEKIDQDFTRMRDAMIYVNNIRIRNPIVPNEKTITSTRGLLTIPVTLVQGANEIKIDSLGYSTARLEYSLELAPTEAQPPLAFFLLNRITGNTTQGFSLNARESYSPDGHLLSYFWTWGDEAPDSTPVAGLVTATHTYATAGTYNAKLRINDQTTSQTAEFAIDLVVTAVNPSVPPANEKPKPVIQWALDSGNPYHVLFNGSQSTDDGSISLYTWRFTNQSGVSQTVTGESVNYTFASAGAYTVRLTVKDDLGLAAAVDRVISVAPISTLVADEILFTEKTYFGTLATEAVTTETLNLPHPTLARVKFKNADGLEHPVEDCGPIAYPGKIACLYTNLVNRTYLSLYRVSSVNLFVNGRKVTDAVSMNKLTGTFETVVALNSTNTLEVHIKGWPTAFATMELQSLEENIPPVADVTFAAPTAGIPKTVEFNAVSSTDANDQIMSYRFQARINGTIPYTLDSDWQAAPSGSLTFTAVGTYDVLVSARDKFGAVGTKTVSVAILPNTLPVITLFRHRLLNNQAPFQVRFDLAATDVDQPTGLEYNVDFSTGDTTGFQPLTRVFGSFPSVGMKSATLTVRDSSGETVSRVLNFEVGNNSVPVANFTIASRAAQAPNTITFDGSPSFDPDGFSSQLQYFWTFGDGTPEVTGKIVTHTFPAGDFVVSLTVLDSRNAISTLSRAVFSWLDQPPVPSYVFTRGPGPLQINFDASASTPGNSPIIRYNFELGDGYFQNVAGPGFSYTYAAPGVYSTSLRVFDQEGDANIAGQTITVFNGNKPTANIRAVSYDVITPATYNLDAQGSASPTAGATIAAYRWTLPSGEIRTTSAITYNTAVNSDFAIKLEVQDSLGVWSDQASRSFLATSGQLPQARITVPRTDVALGQSLQFSGANSFSNNSTANLSTFEWTLQNGNKLFGVNPTVTFTSTGLKTITLKVTDSKGYASALASIQVNVYTLQKPIAVMALATNGQTVIPVTGHASGALSTTPNPSAVITGYEWSIKAPTTPGATDYSLFGRDVDIPFNQVTTYTVALRVFDSAGGTSDWVSETFGPTTNTIPVAVISPVGLIDSAPSTIIFNGLSSSDPDGHLLISWHWLFSDGTDAYGPTPSHYFASPGTYTATLRVQDEYFAWSDPVQMTVTILPNQFPIPFITMTNDPLDRNHKTFSGSTSFDMDGTVDQYRWFIVGDGTILGTGPDFSYVFSGPGSYAVGLNIFDNKGAKSSTTYSFVIAPDSPTVIRAHYEVDETDPMKFAFKSSDSTDADGITSYKWTEDGATLSTAADFTKTFTTEGVHHVVLEIRDSGNAIASKAFDVRASSSSLAGIHVGSADAERTEYFGSSSLSAQSPVFLGATPAKVLLQPQLLIPADGKSFDWYFGSEFLGTSESLPVSLASSSGPTSLKLIVFDGDNITDRATRVVSTSAEYCGDGESNLQCASVENPITGAKLLTDNLILTLPMEEPIAEIGSATVSSADGLTSVQFGNVASIESNQIAIPRLAILNSALSSATGPFVAEVNVMGATEGLSARVPDFNIATARILIASTVINFHLRILDSHSNRVVIDQDVVAGSTIVVPATLLEITASYRSLDGSSQIAIGSLATNISSNVNLTVAFSGGAGFGIIYPTATAISVFSKGLSQQTQAAANTPFVSIGSAIVAGIHTSEDGGVNTGEYLLSDNRTKAESRFWRYSVRDDLIPWDSIAAGTPIGNSVAQERSVECKVFEGNWEVNPSVQSALDDHDQLAAAGATMARISVDRSKIEAPLSVVSQKIFNSAGGTALSLEYLRNLLQHPDPNSVDFTTRTLSSCCLVDIAKYLALTNQLAGFNLENGPVEQQAIAVQNAFNQKHYGTTSPAAGVGARWKNYDVSAFHEFELQIKFQNAKGKTTILKRPFSSKDRIGNYVPSSDTVNWNEINAENHYRVPVPKNPFDVDETVPIKFPIKIPAKTTSLNFSVVLASKLGVPEVKKIRYEDAGVEQTSAASFSVACRLADDAATVQSIRFEPKFQNADLSQAAVEDLADIFDGAPILENLGNPAIAATQLERTRAYISGALFGPKSFVPVELDLDDTSSHSNTLWFAFGAGKPQQTADLNHSVRVEITHPSGKSPDSIELSVKSAVSADALVVAGTKLSGGEDRRTWYRLDVPVDVIIAMARNISFNEGAPRDPSIKFEFRPVYGSVTDTVLVSKSYSPRVLFNARYKTFAGFVSAKRETYSRHISAFVAQGLASLSLSLDVIGSNSLILGPVNDYRINDGSLPFAGSFRGVHAGHDDGRRLDMRTFGVETEGWESVGSQTRGGLIAPNTKLEDIAILIRAGRIASYVNEVAIEKLPRQSDCPAADGCNGIETLEKCIFTNSQVAPTSTCLAMRDVVANVYTLERVRLANERLAKWIMRNQEALKQVQAKVWQLKIKNFFILHSNGSDISAKGALFDKINVGGDFPGKLHGRLDPIFYDDWNYSVLLDGKVPQTNTDGTVDKQLYILNPGSERISTDSSLRSLFLEEKALVHFDHFHLNGF